MAVDGKWNLTIKTPMGDQTGVLTLKQEGDALTGDLAGNMGTVVIENGRVEGDQLMWDASVTSPMPVKLEFSGKLDGAALNGDVKLGAFGQSTFAGEPA
ncbi:MAG: hypothetical protein AAGC56_07120 [Pseudomonadota bacterium]